MQTAITLPFFGIFFNKKKKLKFCLKKTFLNAKNNIYMADLYFSHW